MKTLLTPRWALALLLVLAAVTACILLGRWQFHRYEAKAEAVATIERNYDAAPVDPAGPLPSPTSALRAEDDYTQVTMTGQYRSEDTLFVRNRTRASQVGFLQLVPFTDGERTLLVVRGWVPAAKVESTPAGSPPLPDGTVTLTAHLRPTEPRLGRAQTDGQVQSINVPDVQEQTGPLPGVMTGAYGTMISEDPSAPPADASAPLMPVERPETDTGPHLSYAFQWWVFAAFFPVGFVVAARRAVLDERDARAESGDPDAEAADGSRTDGPSARSAGAKRPRRRLSDEDEEDMLVTGEGP